MASSNDTYTANGTEGNTLVRSVLIGATSLLCFMDSYPLKQIDVSGTPVIGEFKHDNSTGTLTFGNTLENGQVIQTLYK